MIFSIDTIKQSLDRSTPIVTNESEYDSSIFCNVLEMIMDEQREFENNMINVNEGLISSLAVKAGQKQIDKIKSIDFKEIISKIFDWFINAIEKIHQTFMIIMSKMINKDVRIKLYKNKLANFKGEVTYNRKYFDYTNIFSDSSYSNYQLDISGEYEDLVNKLIGIKDSNSPMKLADTLSQIRDDINSTNNNLDMIRGKLLGLNRPVTNADFANCLFKYFRNDRSEPHNPGLGFSKKNLTSTDIQEAYNIYFSYSKQEKIVRRESMKLKSQALAQKAKIKTINISNYINNKSIITLDAIKEYNEIINIKCRKIRDICNIYTLFYSAKLDALKEYNIKSRDILLVTITEIIKREGEINDNK